MNFYDLEFVDLKGNDRSMSEFTGKVVLIVNTATRCGLAPQFDGLEQLHQQYGQDGLVVLGFPCNQFAGQEPETNETMEQVCKINHGVTFQLTQKIEVNGKNTHPVFAYVKRQSKSGIFGKKIKWNFTKFLVSPDGQSVKRYAPTTKPKEIETDILQFLDKKI